MEFFKINDIELKFQKNIFYATYFIIELQKLFPMQTLDRPLENTLPIL